MMGVLSMRAVWPTIDCDRGIWDHIGWCNPEACWLLWTMVIHTETENRATESRKLYRPWVRAI